MKSIISNNFKSLLENNNVSKIKIRSEKRSIEMFFGRCKQTNASFLSVEKMDEMIMQAVSENNL